MQQQFVGCHLSATVLPFGAMPRQSKDTSPSPHIEFGRRLAAAMEENGVTVEAITEAFKASPEGVRLWLRGKRMPPAAKLKRLAALVGVDPRTLAYGKDGPMPPIVHGMTITDDDEVQLIEAYRLLGKDSLKAILRKRAVQLLEEFGPPGTKNPFAKAGKQ